MRKVLMAGNCAIAGARPGVIKAAKPGQAGTGEFKQI
jgi:hypothetical protein